MVPTSTQPQEGMQQVSPDAVPHKDILDVASPHSRTFSVLAESTVSVFGFTIDGLPPKPVRLKSVEPNTWAQEIGLEAGDELIALNGREVAAISKEEFRDLLTARPLRLTMVSARPLTQAARALAWAHRLRDVMCGVWVRPRSGGEWMTISEGPATAFTANVSHGDSCVICSASVNDQGHLVLALPLGASMSLIFDQPGRATQRGEGLSDSTWRRVSGRMEETLHQVAARYVLGAGAAQLLRVAFDSWKEATRQPAPPAPLPSPAVPVGDQAASHQRGLVVAASRWRASSLTTVARWFTRHSLRWPFMIWSASRTRSRATSGALTPDGTGSPGQRSSFSWGPSSAPDFADDERASEVRKLVTEMQPDIEGQLGVLLGDYSVTEHMVTDKGSLGRVYVATLQIAKQEPTSPTFIRVRISVDRRGTARVERGRASVAMDTEVSVDASPSNASGPIDVSANSVGGHHRLHSDAMSPTGFGISGATDAQSARTGKPNPQDADAAPALPDMDSVRGALEERLDKQFERFVPLEYRTLPGCANVGTTFLFKVQVRSRSFIHLRVARQASGGNWVLQCFQEHHTLADALSDMQASDAAMLPTSVLKIPSLDKTYEAELNTRARHFRVRRVFSRWASWADAAAEAFSIPESDAMHIDTDVAQQVLHTLQGTVESWVGKRFDMFEPLQFKQQVVAGMAYAAKVQTDAGGGSVHLRCYHPLPCAATTPAYLLGVEEGLTLNDELVDVLRTDGCSQRVLGPARYGRMHSEGKVDVQPGPSRTSSARSDDRDGEGATPRRGTHKTDASHESPDSSGGVIHANAGPGAGEGNRVRRLVSQVRFSAEQRLQMRDGQGFQQCQVVEYVIMGSTIVAKVQTSPDGDCVHLRIHADGEAWPVLQDIQARKSRLDKLV